MPSRIQSRRGVQRIALAATAAALPSLPSASSAATLVWDASGSHPTQPTDGGGTWASGIGSTYTWSNGTSDLAWSNSAGNVAQFGSGQGPAGTITLGSAVTANGLSFAAPGSGNYTLGASGGAALSLAGPTPTITVASGLAPTITAPVNSAVTVIKSGAGTLYMSGSNNLSNGLTVTAGTVIATTTGAFSGNGSAGSGGLTVNAGAAATFAAGGASTLQGTIANGGTMTFNASVTNASTVPLVNQGAMTIAAGQTLALGSSQRFNQAGGTLAINGALALAAGGTFLDVGGTITGGPVSMLNGGVYFGPNASAATFEIAPTSGSGNVTISRSGTQENIPAGVVLKVHPTVGPINILLAQTGNYGTLNVTTANNQTGVLNPTGAGGLTNHGLISLSASGTPSQPFAVTAAVTNAADGALTINTPTQFADSLTNAGAVTAAADVTVTNAVINSGSMTVAAGKTFTLGGSAPVFNQSAGTLAVNGALRVGAGGKFYNMGGMITGTVSLQSGGVYFGPSAGPAQFTFTTAPGATSLEAGVYSAYVGNVGGGMGVGTSVVVAPTSGYALFHYDLIENDGAFSFAAANGAGATLSLYAGGSTLINTGTINLSANGTASSPMVVTGTLLNVLGGTLQVSTPLKLYGTLSTSGTTNLSGTLTFNDSSGYVAMHGGAAAIHLSGGASVDLSGQPYGLLMDAGTFTMSPSTTTRSVLKTKLVAWYAPTNDDGTYPTTASIANVGGAPAGALVGQLDMAGGAEFRLGYAKSVLTVSTPVVNGVLTKTGPGTLVLTSANTFAGSTNVSAGTLTLASGSSVSTPLIMVAGGATLNVGTSLPNTTIQSQGTVNFTGSGSERTPSLTIAAGQRATIDTGAVQFGNLSIAGTTNAWTGLLDVGGGAVAVSSLSLATVNNQVRQGFAGGRWNGSGGITSTVAAADASHLMAVGAIQNATAIGGSVPIYTTFEGFSVGYADTLIRYTYYGDTNLDGTVSAADYTRVDAGFINHRTGWQNGDLNYDGVIDGSDYTLMDNAFNRQTGGIGSPAALVATPTASAAPVPEAATVALLAGAVPIVAFVRRRRRSRAGLPCPA